jgi:hypothetical protein
VKSATNRYRPPRIRYELDGWRRKKTQADARPQFGKQALGYGRRKKGKA